MIIKQDYSEIGGVDLELVSFNIVHASANSNTITVNFSQDSTVISTQTITATNSGMTFNKTLIFTTTKGRTLTCVFKSTTAAIDVTVNSDIVVGIGAGQSNLSYAYNKTITLYA